MSSSHSSKSGVATNRGKKLLSTFLELQVWRFELGAWLKKEIVIVLLHSTLKVRGQKQKKSRSAMLGTSKLYNGHG